MLDQKKVVQGLEICMSNDYCHECPYENQCFTNIVVTAKALMSDALALLREQEPVEPNEARFVTFGSCRTCSNCNKYLFPAERYCPHCGRPVKWDNE